MKSQWWSIATLLVAFGLFLPGCGGAPELSTESVEPDEDPEDVSAGAEVPP